MPGIRESANTSINASGKTNFPFTNRSIRLAPEMTSRDERKLQARASRHYHHPERMEITQPKVARGELPWDKRSNTRYPERVASDRYGCVGGSVKMHSPGSGHCSNPAGGGLFIEYRDSNNLSFCFSAARRDVGQPKPDRKPTTSMTVEGVH